MNYAKIEPMSIVDGTGCRVSIFVSGCDIHCNGCFNSIAWDFNYGKKFTEIELNELITLCNKPYISGISILGGEPCSLNNQAEVLKILKNIKQACPGKNVWLFTGYVYEKDLLEGQRQNINGLTSSLLEMVDVLVDGPFILEQRDLTLKFRGSSNQRLLTREDRQRIYNEYTRHGQGAKEKSII